MLTSPDQNQKRHRAILDAIRSQLAASAAADAVHEEYQRTNTQVHSSLITHHSSLITHPSSLADLLSQFREAVEGVAGHCAVVRDEKQAAAEIRRILSEAKPKRVAVSDSALARQLLSYVTLDVPLIENATKEELFDCDLGITGAQWAIAETGTLVLESKSERHRLVSLVPAMHVAIIYANCIRETLSEILQLLSAN